MFQLNYILNRHVKAAFALANGMGAQPPLVEDRFWNQSDVTIGHTYLSSRLREHPPKLHAKVPTGWGINTVAPPNLPPGAGASVTKQK